MIEVYWDPVWHLGPVPVNWYGFALAFQRADGSWLIGGDLHMDLLKDRLGLREIPEERDFHTVAGLILWRLEPMPAVGDHIEFAGFRFEVVDMDGAKIDKVLAIPLNGSEDPSGW